MALSIVGLTVTFSKNSTQNYVRLRAAYFNVMAECHYARCCGTIEKRQRRLTQQLFLQESQCMLKLKNLKT
jgi:hypothetical protein